MIPTGSNADLWLEIRMALVTRRGRIKVEKVKAHTDVEDAVCSSIALQHFAGNSYADALADRAAAEGQLDEGTVAAHQLVMDTLRLIHRRIIIGHSCLLEEAAPRARAPRPKAAPRRTARQRLLESATDTAEKAEHQVQHEQGQLRCTRCLQRSAANQAAWAHRPCPGHTPTSGRTLPACSWDPVGPARLA